MAPAVEAATVAVLRDGNRGLEVLLLRRSDAAGFVPGAHVFPGGAVDPGDATFGDLVGAVDDSGASDALGVGSGGLRFWMAAVRECVEEAAVAPGVVSAPLCESSVPVDLGPWRRELHAGEVTLADALRSAGACVDGSALRCVARWVTPLGSPRRFDTRFFIAAAPQDVRVVPDGSETVSHLWARPADALAAAGNDEMVMILPTVRMLAALADFGSVADAMAELRFGDPAAPLLPEIEQDAQGRTLAVLRGDPEGNGGRYDSDTGMPVAESGRR